MRSMWMTEHFGSKPLSVGTSNFERPNAPIGQKDKPGELQATALAKLRRAGRSCAKRDCKQAPRLRCPAHRAFSRRSGLWHAGLLVHFSRAQPIYRDSNA